MMTSGAFEIDQLLEPVVAVDDPAVEVVQVAGGEVAGIEQHERPQVRRDDRDALQHHPLALVGAVAQGLDDLQPFDEILELGLGRLFLFRFGFQLLAQDRRFLDEVDLFEQLLDGLGAHVGFEAVAVLSRGLCGIRPRSEAGVP